LWSAPRDSVPAPSVIVGWTGHRPDVFRDPSEARDRVEQLALGAYGHTDVRFVCGGQRGVDLWAADIAQRLGIPFELVLPVPPSSFSSEWDDQERAHLLAHVSRAERVTVLDPRGERGLLAYDRRNEEIAYRSELLIAVWTGMRRGGTFYTLCAARRRGIPTRSVLLAPTLDPLEPGRGV